MKIYKPLTVFALAALLLTSMIVPQAGVLAADGDPKIFIDTADVDTSTEQVDVYFGDKLTVHGENVTQSSMEIIIEKYTTPEKANKVQMSPNFVVKENGSLELLLTAPNNGKDLSDFTPGYYVVEIIDKSADEPVVLDSKEFNVLSSATGAKIEVLNPNDVQVDGTVQFSITYKLKGSETFEASPQELQYIDTNVAIQTAEGGQIAEYSLIHSAFPSDLYSIENGVYTVKLPDSIIDSSTSYIIKVYPVVFNFNMNDGDYGTLMGSSLAEATFTTQKSFTITDANITPDAEQNLLSGAKFNINLTFDLLYEDDTTTTTTNISSDLFELDFYYGENGLTPVVIPEDVEVIKNLGNGQYEITLDPTIFTTGRYNLTVEPKTDELVKPWDNLILDVEPFLLTELNENLSANLNPSFSSSILNYTLAATSAESSVDFSMKVSGDDVTVQVTSDNDSSITPVKNTETGVIDADVNLATGNNTVKITLTSSFADIGDVQQVYTVVVNRAGENNDEGGGSGGGGGGGAPSGGGGSSGGSSSTSPGSSVVETLELGNTCADTNQTFTDIKGHWAASFIAQLAANGVVSGKSEGIYAPNEYLTRAEAAKIVLCNLRIQMETGGNGFSDTNNHWASDIIATAKKMGIVHGYPDGTFRPNSRISRAEVLVMLLNAQGADYDNVPIANFSDVDQSAWYAASINFAFEHNIVSGYGNGTFGPHNYVTRGEMAKIALLASELYTL